MGETLRAYGCCRVVVPHGRPSSIQVLNNASSPFVSAGYLFRFDQWGHLEIFHLVADHPKQFAAGAVAGVHCGLTGLPAFKHGFTTGDS